MYENVYGLSCVENQVLEILDQQGFPVSQMYAHSSIPLKELFFFFVINNDKYEFFTRIPRIQNILKDMGIVSLELKKTYIKNARYAIRNVKDNEYILMKINSRYAKEKLYCRALRSDHVALVKAIENNFQIFNDIPSITKEVSARELCQAYDGEYFKLTILKDIPKDDLTKLWKSRMFKPEQQTPFCFYKSDFDKIDNLARRLRDMTIVYKTTRHRIKNYYGNYLNTVFMTEYINQIEKIQYFFEYHHLKKNNDVDKLYELLLKLNAIENELVSKLRSEIEGIKCDRNRTKNK